MPIIHGDCIEVMARIDDNSVDAIVTDLPFGTTQNKWDNIIPFDKLWLQYNRIRKKNSPIVLFGQGMFTAELMMSNSKMWRYNLIWEKSAVTGFLNANKQPLRSHEDILIFYEKCAVYNPQKTIGKPNHSRGIGNSTSTNYNHCGITRSDPYDNMKHPRSVLHFDTVPPSKKLHPTQKPVALLEYLIRTYTNEHDIVLDSCIGSGTTAVACIRSGRQFVGIEKEKKYFDMANEEIKKEHERKLKCQQ